MRKCCVYVCGGGRKENEREGEVEKYTFEKGLETIYSKVFFALKTRRREKKNADKDENSANSYRILCIYVYGKMGKIYAYANKLKKMCKVMEID